MTAIPHSRPIECSFDALSLSPAPITTSWILDGDPVVRSAQWATAGGGTTTAHVWECTAGTFRWHFHADELVHILEGSVTITDADDHTFTLSVGDAAMFHAGTSSVWTVSTYVRKYAVLSLPRPTLRGRLAHLYNTYIAGRRP